MSACVPITLEEIRGEVWMGTTLLAKTPALKSFNVGKSRGQISNTFNATFDMLAGISFPLGEKIIIKAGTKNNLQVIFTGFIESTNVQPSYGKPSYLSVTLAGQGVLSQLANKKFSRRLKASGQGLFCLITGGSANRPAAYYSGDKSKSSGNTTTLNPLPDPARRGGGEHSPLVTHKDNHSSTGASGGRASDLAGYPSGTGEEGNTGLTTHTHESTEQGGPAFAVYSSD